MGEGGPLAVDEELAAFYKLTCKKTSSLTILYHDNIMHPTTYGVAFLFFIFYFTNKSGIFDPKRIKISLATATNFVFIHPFGLMIYSPLAR